MVERRLDFCLICCGRWKLSSGRIKTILWSHKNKLFASWYYHTYFKTMKTLNITQMKINIKPCVLIPLSVSCMYNNVHVYACCMRVSDLHFLNVYLTMFLSMFLNMFLYIYILSNMNSKWSHSCFRLVTRNVFHY